MVITDNTVLVELQESVKRKETLAAVGELAAHVAHEVRNPLGSMRIYLDLMRRGGRLSAGEEQYLDKLSSELRRLEGIVDNFLRYSAPSRLFLSEFSLADLVEDTLAFAGERDEFSRLEVETNLRHRGDFRVRADKDQFRQMLLNLFLNAAEAMPEGGTISVTLERHDPTYTIRVSDTGCGMDEEVKEKIFQPFFTTKGNGTGLGMALVQRIVENHGGAIEIDSAPGKGTEVVLTFPLDPRVKNSS